MFHVPIKSVRSHTSIIWDTRTSRHLVSKKAAAYRKFQQSRSSKDYSQYASIRNKVTNEIRKNRKVYESKVADSCRKNRKRLFAYIRSKTRLKGKNTFEETGWDFDYA